MNKIMWMLKKHKPEICDIEETVYGNDGYAEKELEKLLRPRDVIGLVCVNHIEQVLGYAIYTLLDTHIYLNRLVVDPLFQQEKIGTQLMNNLKGRVDNMNNSRTKIRTYVPDHCLTSHLFLKSQGFKAIEVDGDNYLFEYVGVHSKLTK